MKKVSISILAAFLLLAVFANLTVPHDLVKKDILTQTQIETINTRLVRFAERNAGFCDPDEIDFSEWAVGQAVKAYEYLETGLAPIERFYPLFCEGQLRAFAIDTEDGRFQIATGFVDTITSENITTLALVYDRDSAYLYDGEKFIFMWKNCIEIAGRSSLPDLRFERTSEIRLTSLAPVQSLAHKTQSS